MNVSGWGRGGLGLDMGWTINLINMLKISKISSIGLDYGKIHEIFVKNSLRLINYLPMSAKVSPYALDNTFFL